MRSLFILSGLVLIPLFSYCQVTFQRSYDIGSYEYAHTVVQTFDGGYAICGRMYKSPAPVAFLLRTNEYGDTLWSRDYPGYVSANERIMAQTADSGFIICASEDNDIKLIKTDKNGEVEWTRSYPAGQPAGVAQTADHGFIVCSGGTTQTLVKTDDTGNLEWSKNYLLSTGDPVGMAYPHSLMQTNDGGYVIAGNCDYNAYEMTTLSAFLFKTNGNGDSLWVKKYHTDNARTDAYSVCQEAGNGYFLAGCIYPVLGTSSAQGYIIRTNESGDTLHTERNHYLGSCYISSDNSWDGNIIATGLMQNPYPGGGQAIMLTKYAINGNLPFMRAFPTGNYGNSVMATKDHGFIIAGVKDDKVILVKTDSLGKANPAGINDGRPVTVHGLFPNPSNGKFTLVLSGDETSVEVMDVTGRIVYRTAFSQKPPASLKIDLSTYTKGVYLVAVRTETLVSSGKIILQ